MAKTVVRKHTRMLPSGRRTIIRTHRRKLSNKTLARKAIKWAEKKLIRTGNAIAKEAIVALAVGFLVSNYGFDPLKAKKLVSSLLI